MADHRSKLPSGVPLVKIREAAKIPKVLARTTHFLDRLRYQYFNLTEGGHPHRVKVIDYSWIIGIFSACSSRQARPSLAFEKDGGPGRVDLSLGKNRVDRRWISK